MVGWREHKFTCLLVIKVKVNSRKAKLVGSSLWLQVGKHRCATFALVVNAEVDLMGGVVEGGVTSPWSASLQKVQEKLRQEFDVREESRRQLEFLEKGGDPLQFKYGNAASVSVQSTSLTQPDQFVISEAKGSFAFTASPHGDSVESIGRPGATLLCEPNSADNLLLFDGENECIEGERVPKQYSRTAVATLEQSTQINGNRSAQELGDSAAFDVPRKAYKRRFRRRPNRDGARSSSNDARVSAGFGSFPSHNGLSDTKGVVFDAKNKAVQNGTALLTSENGGVSCKTLLSRNQDDLESGGMKAAESTTIMLKDGEHTVPDLIYSKDKVYIQPGQHSVVSSQESPIEVARVGPESLSEKGKKGPAGQLYVDSVMVENLCGSSQKNGLISAKGGRKYLSSNNETPLTSVLESELSHTHAHINHSLDGNNDREMCTNSRFLDSNGNMKIESSLPEGIINTEMKDEGESKADDNCPFIGDICKSMCENDQYIDSGLKSMEELPSSHSDLHNKVQDRNLIKRKESVTPFSEENDSKQSVRVDDDSNHQNDSTCDVSLQASIDSSIPQLVEVAPDVAVSSAPSEGRQCDVNIKLVSKADEDSILEEARIIEAKHKRITELSAVTCPTENHRKSHWDYVLEEMAWLANDVAQERLWKITAASQISYQAAFTARSGIQEWNTSWKQKGIAQTLAKAVMGFWHSVKGSTLNQVAQCPKEGFAPAVKEYAVRFLNYNYSGPATSKQKVDSEVKGLPWENHLTEENIFYTVPPNATEMYRKSIEAHVLQYERVSSNMHKEVEMSACADLGSEDYVNEEDEGETNTYSVVFEGINPSRFAQRKHKIQMRTNKGRSYDIGADMSFSHCFENKAVNQQYMVQAKRPSSSLNVSFPTKRVRTGSRQRVLSPFIGSTSTSGLHLPLKAEASSGDTSSFQDDQSTLHGGPHNLNTLEDDSAGGFERQLQFDSTEAFSKPKKKKKAKFLNSSYEQRWQDNSGFQNQQRESSRKRLDGFQVEPSCSGQFGLHISKKQKIMRPSMENSFDNISPVLGSVASPVASQMSNMSNPNRIMKMLAGRDRSRKGKNPKSPAGYLTSGSQWSLFEDQALVVLVHDMGPNWELVSDAINSTLQFKCIYRKPKECRERHKILMDKTNSDAADSAEESGPSQPYPSTLPGIPKGSARQLFQRLKGPMEEDTLKSHFEKIILIGQKYLYHKTQGDNRDPKQLQQPHSSHAHALSQVFPNNMNGVPMLTPLDLCDSSPPPSSDMVSHGHQSSSTLAVSSPPGFLGGAEAASSASNSFLQGSSNIVSGNSFPSSSTSPNATVRDGRYSVSASASVSPFTEQRRNLPYNRVLPGRPNPSASPGAFPGANPGVRMLSAGSNRDGMPVVRPGFQGIIPTSPMLSSVNMIASVNIHSGVGSNNTKGNSMLRPHDALNVMQPTPQSNNNQVNPSFGGGLNTTSYSNQIPSPPTSSYPVVHPQGPNNNNVITNPQKQALLQLAKDRQLQQRLLQHQFGASNPMISPSQTTSPASSLSTTSVTPMPPSSSMTPAPHHQLKQLKHSIVPTHGLARGGAQGVAGVSSSQVVSKQRPRQTHVLQQQHSSRSHPQPRQQLPPHQQAKTVNGAGRASLLNGSASNTVQPTKLSSSITNTQVPPQSQQKIYSVKVSSQTESVQQKPSCSDDVSQGHGQPITVGPAVSCFSHQPQSHPQPRLLMSQSQPNSQRVEKHTAACSSSAGLMMSASMDCSGAADMVPDDVSAGAQAEPSNNPADDKIDSQDGPLGISRRRSSGNLSPEGKNVNVQLQQQSHTALREPLQHQHQQVLRGNSNLCDPHNDSGPD